MYMSLTYARDNDASTVVTPNISTCHCHYWEWPLAFFVVLVLHVGAKFIHCVVHVNPSFSQSYRAGCLQLAMAE